MNISEIRDQYPQYSDLSDEALGRALHRKFYSDMPWAEFATKTGVVPQNKTDDPGVMGSVAIGAGRMFDKLAKGLEQGAMTIGSTLGNEAATKRLSEMAPEEAENDRLYQNLQQQHPFAATAGEMLPILPVGAVGSSIKGVAAANAIPGLLEYGTPTEKLTRGALGAGAAAAGGMIGKGFGTALQPTRELSDAQVRAMEAADRLGVKLTAGEASGNKAARWMESASADLPIASGIAKTRTSANDKAISQAAARSIGQRAEEITPEVLANARSAIGAEYNRILEAAKIPLDSSFRGEVKAITGSKVMKELRDEGTEALIDKFRNLPQGKISVTGEWFQQNKSALDAAIRSAYTAGESGKARALEQFEKALDRAAMRALPEADQAAYKTAQRQWANLRLLESGQVVDGGRVMPGRLNQALTSRYKGAYKEGKIQGELPDIAALAKTLQSPPQSGSVPRAYYTGAMAGALFEPSTLAASFLAPPTVQALATSPLLRSYLTKGLLDVTPELEANLIRGGGLLGLPATTTY